ncbi:hypothetical protein [Nisaea nitritireducens]|uniref:hypothetical protein n=1 Tax=Nisaea nitritireducens TaxID=568392 RepID=UPI0018691767|nr:hypothetical protein [Nisaea nitritireducens]
MEPIRFTPVRVIRRPLFNQGLARFYVALNLSGDDTIDWILDELYMRLERDVIDRNGNLVDLEDVHIEELFGQDPRRYVNAHKQRASGTARQRLHESCVPRVTWMDVAKRNALLRDPSVVPPGWDKA